MDMYPEPQQVFYSVDAPTLMSDKCSSTYFVSQFYAIKFLKLVGNRYVSSSNSNRHYTKDNNLQFDSMK